MRSEQIVPAQGRILRMVPEADDHRQHGQPLEGFGDQQRGLGRRHRVELLRQCRVLVEIAPLDVLLADPQSHMCKKQRVCRRGNLAPDRLEIGAAFRVVGMPLQQGARHARSGATGLGHAIEQRRNSLQECHEITPR